MPLHVIIMYVANLYTVVKAQHKSVAFNLVVLTETHCLLNVKLSVGVMYGFLATSESLEIFCTATQL